METLQMTYTVQYETTGQVGTRPTRVINRIGKFPSKAEAQTYLARAQIANASVVEAGVSVLVTIARRAGIEAAMLAYDAGVNTPAILLPGHAHPPVTPPLNPRPIRGWVQNQTLIK